MENYTKKNLITDVATETEMSKKDMEMIVNTVFDTIQGQLEQGNKVSIFGFGNFEVKDVLAKDGITMLGENKGQPWHKDASKAVRFKVAKSLKEAVNN